jgi:hypothetical protein
MIKISLLRRLFKSLFRRSFLLVLFLYAPLFLLSLFFNFRQWFFALITFNITIITFNITIMAHGDELVFIGSGLSRRLEND